MITKLEHQLVELSIRGICGLYQFPHELVKTSNGLQLIPCSGKKELLVKINCFISLLYAVFLAGRLLHPSLGYTPEELQTLTFETLVHYFWLFVHFTCFVIQLFAVQYKSEFAYLYNQVLKFNLEGGKRSVIQTKVKFDIS